MGAKKLIAVIIVAMPMLACCSHKSGDTAQNLDNTLNTASGVPITVNSPAEIIGNPEATQVAQQCEGRANNIKKSGQTDAAAQNAYYDCLQAVFHVAE